MSIEAMKRIKSLLQDTKIIDSHTLSAVVAECDMAILAKQPVTTEPVAWMASYVDPVGNDHVYVTSHRDLAVENDMHGEPKPLYTHPAPSVPATTEPVMDVRCEGCGYMTHHREHMGCVRAAKQHTHPAPSVPDGYALVPIEPTDEMMSEMLGPFIALNGDNRSAFIEAYPRMLAAAKKETP